MNVFNAIWIAITTYSVLPAPRVEWTVENVRGAICFLPLVGILLGAALLLWQWLCLALQAEAAVFAALAALLPLLLSGGIHMDGFMDTLDALASHQPRERKLAIMRDSHVGAFAVIGCTSYLLLSFGLYWALYQRGVLWLVGIGFLFSRFLCAWSTLTLPNARDGGMLHAFTKYGHNRGAVAVMCIFAILCAVAMVALGQYAGLCGAAAAFLIWLGYRHTAKKQFAGITGDTCGFFIQLCELCLLFGVWFGGLL